MTHITQSAPTAKGIYEALEANARGNKQRVGTLHRLRQSCDALVAAGKDFSLREIADYCQSTFGQGPNAQSISNDKSLRSYVDARRNEADLRRRHKPRSPLDQDVEDISDPDLRSRMRVVIEDYRLLQKRFRILTESLAKLTPPLDLDALLTGKREHHTISIQGRNVPISFDQVNSFQRLMNTLLDPERMRRAGLVIDSGDIIGGGLRETLIEERDIKLLQMLLLTLDAASK